MPLTWLIAGSLWSVAVAAIARTTQLLRRERARAHVLEKHLDVFCESLPVGVFETDDDGRWSYSNELACRLAGLELGGELGETWLQAVHPDDRDRVVSGWMAAAAVGAAFRDEYRYLRPDGSTVWVLGEVRPHRDASGRRHGFIGAITDITGRKLTEQELERSRVELERRVAERTAILRETNRLLSREVRVRERLERATIGQMPADVKEPPARAPRRRGVDQ